ncbi:MAG: methylmalonyl Co-A mutase-associated GTPase MeaB [Atribacterota bacterium]|nr:methylmalonyl Co-A mutase-associated GTPase MeaB [Atribacterota bacterium]
MDLITRIREGDTRSVARLISMVENDFQSSQPILKELHKYCGKAIVIGITGSPGSGKSTITDKLTKHLRHLNKKVGIIAIDPSSPFSGGAILGDRIRMQDHTTDKDVFIRSIGARGHLGGLSRSTQAIVRIMDAMGKDIIFIETVGVGQSEIDIIKVSDVVLLIVMPGMGDDIQIIKAGIMEIGDIFVVNKSDRDGSDKLVAEIEMLLHLNPLEKKWEPSIIKTIGTENIGINLLWQEINRLFIHLKESGDLLERRKNRTRKEIIDLLQETWREMFFEYIGKERIEKEISTVLYQNDDPYSAVKNLILLFKEKIFKEDFYV